VIEMSNENINNTTKTERVLTDEDIKAIGEIVSKAVVEAMMAIEKQKEEKQKEKKQKEKTGDPMTKLIDFAMETMRAERELEIAFRFMSLLTRRRRF